MLRLLGAFPRGFRVGRSPERRHVLGLRGARALVGGRAARWRGRQLAAVALAVGETAILLHPPLPLVVVSMAMERESVSELTEPSPTARLHVAAVASAVPPHHNMDYPPKRWP